MVQHCIIRRSAAARLLRAEEMADLQGDVVIIGATREAADDFARTIATARAATFGMHRFSLAQFASRITRLEAARRAITPAASLMLDALTARAAHDAAADGLQYFGPVARTPGFPRAVRCTVTELRLAELQADQVATARVVGRDVASLLEHYEAALDEHAISDLADLFSTAAELLETDPPDLAGASFVLLDVPVWSTVERSLVRAMVARARTVTATVPFDDRESEDAYRVLGFVMDGEEAARDTTLDRVRQNLFAADALPECAPDDTVVLFSAPGEGREAVEIARAILSEAQRGVRFDAMAVALRNPAHYVPHLETALRRAGIPYYLACGARRPDAAGRAFLALLACGAENYSARRFAEYLSLGQVPRTAAPGSAVTTPSDPTLRAALGLPEDVEEEEPSDDEAALREPWKWEEFIVEAAVLGGADRWARRLAGLEREYGLRLQRAIADDPEGARAVALRRDAARLVGLRAFAVPIIERLEELARATTWGAWLDLLAPLARVTLKRPERVLRALADIRPLASVGPVGFADVVAVLESRLTSLERPQAPTRFGAVFVAPLGSLRGRSFRTVFVPGLGERAFPARLREDPILLDRVRADVDAGLERQDQRSRRERLLLRLAVGAAAERLFVSYSRMDVREGRGRVSSFYALDVARVMRGTIPDYEALERAAAETSGVSMAWPAPEDATRSIDALEHDLASLKRLLVHPDPAAVRGHANYLLQLHSHLGRALRMRKARWRRPWTAADGMWNPTGYPLTLLQQHGLRLRPYSASALERFAACPYRFYLSAILRLTAREEPERIEAIDRRTRGTLVHAVYANVLRALHVAGLIPLTGGNLAVAHTRADEVLDATAAEFHDLLAPAIDAIWRTDIEGIRTDMRIWLDRLAAVADDWVPMHAELGFGIPLREGLDPASTPDPVVLQDGWQLRGSVDLVEIATTSRQLRIRDYKTGENKTKANLVVGFGRVLQPLLYALAAESLRGLTPMEGQLWFATSRSAFTERSVPVTPHSRQEITQVLDVIDTAVREGQLGAAPIEGSCGICDYRTVCGPYEETRIKKKNPGDIAQLTALRERP